jgi:pimeloyl-ACP methyl ester carboxylesterase
MMPPRPPDIPAAQERSVTIAGRRMRYLICGSGPPLVMLHGLLGYSFSWRFAFDALGQVATVYAPDALGAGFSERDDGLDCSLAGFAQRSLEFMDALGLRDADLLGTSHGGAVAVFAAALDQEKGGKRIRRLLLVDAVNPWSARGRILIPLLSGPVGRLLPWATRTFAWTHSYWLGRQYADTRKIRPGTLEGYRLPLEVQGTIEHARRILHCWMEDLKQYEQKLARVRHLPTLLLWGAEDQSVFAKSAREIERRMEKAELVVLDDVGHLPYEEAPSEFNRVVVDFLRRTPK